MSTFDGDYGPAWRRLTEKQRRYVMAMGADPLGNPTAWARAAGYSDHLGRARVSGHELSHHPVIAAAIAEYARGTMGTVGVLLGMTVAMRIAKNDAHPRQLNAAVALMDRGGLPAQTQHNVAVHHTDQTGEAVIERIRVLAAELGMDAQKLLGGNTPKLIEGEVVSREPSD